MSQPAEPNSVKMRNSRGEWIPAIPLPFFARRRCVCECGERFKTEEAYQGHYALRHILAVPR